MATPDPVAVSLAEQAQQFADRLTANIHSVAPGCSPFQSRAIAEKLRFQVRQDPDTGIPLTVDGAAILTLKVSYVCTLDGHDRYLAVDGSKVVVYAGTRASGEPLFRYEYLRQPHSNIPAAHLQIHAHRDAITYVMSQSGDGTRRGRDRLNGNIVPRLSELHFPLGGHRFRPCLEDVLEILVEELGVDCDPNGREALRRGREQWRRSQVRAVVRDAPDAAIECLGELGYDVNLRDGSDAPLGNPARLRNF